ncbi:MAG: DUF423 domain-containing protein [Saprospiraceae bacterium]|nr:DUF423 domain-containing protein [Saprospiraceae bacterium]
MEKRFIQLGAIFGFLAVALGAFGAHGLKKLIDASQLVTFETGVRYQFYHALALLAVGILAGKFPSKRMNWIGWLFVAGIVCFSGSIYLLSTRTVLGIENTTILGPITPIGGTLFLAGWLILFLEASKWTKS